MTLLFRWILITASLLISVKSYSYTNFIGYGYGACLTCHYNAFGNGPLNDYGRALGANLVSGRLFIPKSISDSDLSEKSGFLFGGLSKNNTWLRPSFDYRGIRVTRNAGQPGNDSDIIHMQADFNVVMKFMEDKLITSFSYGLEPLTNAQGETEYDPISREHYLSYAFTPNFRIYGGKMDVVYGVRIPDHIAYGRRVTGLDQRDQTHGAVVHYYNESFEVGGHLFVGDLEDEPELQFSGISGMGEYSLASDIRVGGSIYAGSNEFESRTLVGGHFRMGFFKGASLIGEYGILQKEVSVTTPSVKTSASYWLLQSMIKLIRGLHFLSTIEHYDDATDLQDDQLRYRYTFGLQWFPVPRVEIRSELAAERFMGPASGGKDNWTFLNQLHLWF